jgi:uncharacterized OB-fold protein
MEKERIACKNCGNMFYPDDEYDCYCCEECLDEANAAYNEED